MRCGWLREQDTVGRVACGWSAGVPPVACLLLDASLIWAFVSHCWRSGQRGVRARLRGGGTAVGGAPPSAPSWRGRDPCFASSPTTSARSGGHAAEGRWSAVCWRFTRGVIHPWRGRERGLLPHCGLNASLAYLGRTFRRLCLVRVWDRSLADAFGAERVCESRKTMKKGVGQGILSGVRWANAGGRGQLARSSSLQASAVFAVLMAAVICCVMPAKIWT